LGFLIEQRMNPNYKKKLAPPVALLMILLAYIGLVWPALNGPFVFDDFPNLQNLELLNGNVSGNLGLYLASFIGSPGRPISALSFLINDNAWPSEPFSFKYTNLMIHLLNSVLLFGMLRQLAKANPTLPQSPLWPLLAMVAWSFHPLQLSAQMLVVQRMTLLSATFCFIGLWGYIALLQRAKSLLGDFTALCVLGACTILAFLCKENGALLPLFAWVLNTTLLSNLLISKSPASHRLIYAACIMPSLAVFAAIAYLGTRPDVFASRDYSLLERMMTQMHVLADYLHHILMPRLSGSGIYFDDYPVTRSWTQPISTVLIAIGFVASLLFAIAKRNHFPVVSFSILWFFAGHVMESSILNLELFFEHRNYLPLLGPVFSISVWAFQPIGINRLGLSLFLVWLLLLGAITSLQASVWGNTQLMTTLWANERPLSLRATQQLAKFQYDNGMRQDALDELMQAYDRGIKQPDLPLAGLIIRCWNQNIKTNYNLYGESTISARNGHYSNSVLVSLGLLRKATQENSCDRVINQDQWLKLTEAFLKNPKFRANAEDNLRIERAKFFIHSRDFTRTITELEHAYSAEPSVELSYKIAEVFLSAGLINEANDWLEKGLKLDQQFFDRIMHDPKNNSIQLREALIRANQSSSKKTGIAVNSTKQ